MVKKLNISLLSTTSFSLRSSIAMSEFKGKTISVITTDDIRYVGVLDDIDGDKGTLSLVGVKILGTEDRVLDAQKVQFPQTRTYPALQLGGQDVKELNILDLKVEDVQAIPIPKSVLQKLLPEETAKVTEQPKETKKENDFDFESNNNKFDKEKLLDQDNENDDGSALYDKKVSFFDNLSSSNDDNGRLTWSEERSMNVDTFGKSSLRRGGNRGRGGRGRGGRGGRGRGNRGGNNNFSSNNNKKTPEWAF